MPKPITLDGEIADQITLLSLKDHRTYLKKSVQAFKKGQYLHPEDLAHHMELIEALDKLIAYFE